MFGLSVATRQHIVTCLSGFKEIKQAVIFGSRATGTYRAGSDIDIALWLTSDNPLIIGRIATALDELPTPYLFDVVDYHAISHLSLKAHIDHYGKPLI
jgi:predicted nucleotidyltransferase